MNKKRQLIWDKSNGKCWYCGCELGEKGWHADHFEPIFREVQHTLVDCPINGMKGKFTSTCQKPELDTINNMVPACRACNLFKATFSIEALRKEISYQVDRARKYSVNFRAAERYGLIEISNKPITFWFESNT